MGAGYAAGLARRHCLGHYLLEMPPRHSLYACIKRSQQAALKSWEWQGFAPCSEGRVIAFVIPFFRAMRWAIIADSEVVMPTR